MKKKDFIFLLVLFTVYFVSITAPWFLTVSFYTKHLSIFLILSYISYLIIRKVFTGFNQKAMKEKQIRKNQILRITTLGIVLIFIIFAQLRFIETKDTLELDKCDYYDQYGNLIFESEYHMGCAKVNLIKFNEFELQIEFEEYKEPTYLETYFYNPILRDASGGGEYYPTVQSKLEFESLSTITIHYNSDGLIIDADMMHSLVVRNHTTNQAVLTTKRVYIENTYIKGEYSSIKMENTGYKEIYPFDQGPTHMDLTEFTPTYKHTYTETSNGDTIEMMLYQVVSDSLGHPLEEEKPELILSSEIHRADDELNINVILENQLEGKLTILEDTAFVTYGDEHIYSNQWENVGNIPLFRTERIAGSEFKAYINVLNDGNEIIYFEDYRKFRLGSPNHLKLTEYGYINELYRTNNENYFGFDEDFYEQSGEDYGLMNYNFGTIFEIYEHDLYFNVNRGETLYQKIPYFYSFYD
ncbi:MAG: hypothetical protein ACVCEJ_06350 [Candidatus Izemoplasmataceae bacterium]